MILTHVQGHKHPTTHTDETETKQTEMDSILNTSKRQNKQNKHSYIIKEHGMTVKNGKLKV